MQSRRGWRGFGRLLSGVLAVLVASLWAPQAARAEWKPLPDQQARITQMTASIHQALRAGGASQEDADQAVRAVRAAMIAGYYQGASDKAVDQAAGPILDAYINRPASITVSLSADQQADVETLGNLMHGFALRRLSKEDAAALAHTSRVAATNQMADGAGYAEVKERQQDLRVPFNGLPDISDPTSPFYDGPPVVVEQRPQAQPPASAPVTAPPVSAAPPPDPVEQAAQSNPDGITVQTDDGRTIQSRPDGDGGTIYVQDDPDDGDATNAGNSKNRTGGNDKKDSKNSGGGGGCCGHKPK